MKLKKTKKPKKARQKKGERRGPRREALPFLYDYQNDFRLDESRFRLINKSRQIGVSFVATEEAVEDALFFGEDTLLVSSSQRQSREMMYKCKRWFDYFSSLGIDYELETDTKEEVAVVNGGRIFSMPSNPETVRGFAGNIIIDEFALHGDQREIYSALIPSITRGFRITIISTPLGEGDLFHEIFTKENEYPLYSRREISIYDAIKGGFDVDIDEIRQSMDDESFEQEFLCKFVSEIGSFISYSIIKNCIGTDKVKGENYMGIDVGRKKDVTVIYIVTRLKGRFYTLNYWVLRNKSFEEQYNEIIRTKRENDVWAVAVDSTGLGITFYEGLMDRLNPLEQKEYFPIHFNIKSKERMAINTKKLFEDKKIQIPEDRMLINDIHSIKKTISEHSNVRFESSGDKSHGDRFWALALALDVATMRKSETRVTKFI